MRLTAVHHTAPEPIQYHYEDKVKIVDGFYRGRSGTVDNYYVSILGRRHYTIRLDAGGLAFRIDAEDLKLTSP